MKNLNNFAGYDFRDGVIFSKVLVLITNYEQLIFHRKHTVCINYV